MSGPMNFVYPVQGDTTDVWGTALNTLLGLAENHTHEPGKGVQVPTAGLALDADLTFASFAALALKAVAFTEQAPAAVTSYSDALFVSSADHNLYFRNQSGVNVQVTAGNTLNISLVGGIGGDYAAVNALLSYDDATHRYLFQQEGSPRPWAGAAVGNVDIYEQAASISNRVRLQSPSGLAASYAVTWLAALPASAMGLSIDNAGQLAAGASFAMQANANVTLSGTGSYKHGSKTLVVPVVASTGIRNAGSVSTTDNNVGAVLAANSIYYFALPQISQHQRIVGVQAWFQSAADCSACTCTIYQTSNANPPGTTLSSTGTALSTISSAEASVSALTLQPTNGRTYWLQVGNDASPRTLVAIGITYDVP